MHYHQIGGWHKWVLLNGPIDEIVYSVVKGLITTGPVILVEELLVPVNMFHLRRKIKTTVNLFFDCFRM